MKYNKNEIIGRMRDRIIIQNVTRLKSNTGFAQETWADSAIVWANAESKLPPSNETVIDGKNTAKNISDFTIRYTTGISEESRVIWNDKLYQVKNIKVSHDRRFISFQGEFYDSYVLTGISLAAFITANAALSADAKVIHNVLAAMNAIATTNAELIVTTQGLVEVEANLNALSNISATATKVIQINTDVTADGTLAASATKVINIDSASNANATLVSDLLLTKTLSSTFDANATISADFDVITQGIVNFDANLNALGTIEAAIKRTVTLESSATTSATTQLNATLTKVIEAAMSASATTESEAILTKVINAETNALATTSAEATLSYTVNAEMSATAQTTVDAQITRIISAEMNAVAQTSIEAGIGVTFVSSLMANASLTDASATRTATLQSALTANCTTTASLTLVNNLTANVVASATVTNTDLQLFDPNFGNIELLLHGNGTNGSTTFNDDSKNNFIATRFGNTVISTAQSKFGGASILFDGNGDYLNYLDVTNFDLPNNFTIEAFVYITAYSAAYLGNYGAAIVCNYSAGGTNNQGWQLRINGTSNSYTTINVYTGTTDLNFSAGTIALNTWHHIAVSRSGTSIRAYLNGTQVGSTLTNSDSFTHNKTINRPLFIGGLNDVTYKFWMNGYIDELRITKGIARYTGSTLIVPTREFLNQ